ncbi:hypothetical protein K8T06_16725 [bacterium]|nr:hypothetical protein [bacterium]
MMIQNKQHKRIGVMHTATGVFFLGLFLLTISLGIIDSCSAVFTSDLKYFKLVQMPGIGDDQLVYIKLDDEIFKFCNQDFSDVRLFDAKKNEISRIIQQKISTEKDIVSHYENIEIENLIQEADNQIEFIVKLPENIGPIVGIRFQTPLIDFEKKIIVTGKTGDGQWGIPTENAMIYDFSRFADVRKLEIRLSPAEYIELKIQIRDVTDVKESRIRKLSSEFSGHGNSETTTEEMFIENVPFRIDRFQIITESERPISRKADVDTYEVQSFDVSRDEEKKQTVVEIKTNREPLV